MQYSSKVPIIRAGSINQVDYFNISESVILFQYLSEWCFSFCSCIEQLYGLQLVYNFNSFFLTFCLFLFCFGFFFAFCVPQYIQLEIKY